MISKIVNCFRFFQQVKSETLRVSWPSNRETAISTVMVITFSVVAMFFFFFVDHVLAYGIDFILGGRMLINSVF